MGVVAYNIAADRVQFVPQVCLQDTRYLRLYTYSIEYILALFVLFSASFKHKSKDASAETIVKLHNSTVQSARDRRIEQTTQMGVYPRGVEFTFSAKPFSPTRNRGQEVGDSRPDYITWVPSHNHKLTLTQVDASIIAWCSAAQK